MKIMSPSSQIQDCRHLFLPMLTMNDEPRYSQMWGRIFIARDRNVTTSFLRTPAYNLGAVDCWLAGSITWLRIHQIHQIILIQLMHVAAKKKSHSYMKTHDKVFSSIWRKLHLRYGHSELPQWRSRETNGGSVFYNALIEYTCCSLVRDLRTVCWSRIETLRGVTRTSYFSQDSCTITKRQNKAGISEFRTTFSYSLKILVATRRAVRGADQDKTSRLKNNHAKPEMVLAISWNPWKHANLR